jgi:hypothetical protein
MPTCRASLADLLILLEAKEVGTDKRWSKSCGSI